jgi:serine/threonine protein kinase
MRNQPRYNVGDVIGKTYQVMQPAMMGGMGEVYLCLSHEDGYPYALKTFQQRYIGASGLEEAFNAEIYKWVQLEKHPTIVRCHHAEILDNQPFMALEYVSGGDLATTLRRNRLVGRTMPLEEALTIAIAICHGLAHAAEKVPGIVHRDLKPGNILLQQGGIAKITDFGLAAVTQEARLDIQTEEDDETDHPGRSLLQANGVAGTPPYMPPEQWDPAQVETLDARTDIYALGCILYEMLTGDMAFRVEGDFTSRTALMQAYQARHAEGPIPDLAPAFPSALQDILAACLGKDVDERPASASRVRDELSTIYEATIGTPPPTRNAGDGFTAIDYNNRGVTYGNINRHEEAIADYDEAIRLDPDLADAYTNRGASYAALGQHQRAIADYDEAIRLDPAFATAYSNRGASYADLGQHQRAIADYDEAIRLDPADAHAYYNRGNRYADLGQHQRAIADYDEAIRLDPDLAHAYYNRGNRYAALGQHQRALQDYDEAIRLDPDLADAYLNKGALLGNLGKLDEALPYFVKAAELGDPNGARYAAMAQQMMGQGDQTPPTDTSQQDQVQAAFDAFQRAQSGEDMINAVQQYPFMVGAQFIGMVEQVIQQQVPTEQRPYYIERLNDLKQIAQGDE